MANCTNIRKLVTKQYNPDGTYVNIVKYINIMNGQEVPASSVRGCYNIEDYDVNCATICEPITYCAYSVYFQSSRPQLSIEINGGDPISFANQATTTFDVAAVVSELQTIFPTSTIVGKIVTANDLPIRVYTIYPIDCDIYQSLTSINWFSEDVGYHDEIKQNPSYFSGNAHELQLWINEPYHP